MPLLKRCTRSLSKPQSYEETMRCRFDPMPEPMPAEAMHLSPPCCVSTHRFRVVDPDGRGSASQRLHPERPALVGKHVGRKQGVGGHVRHDGIRELPTLTQRQRIANPGEGACQPPAMQQAEEHG